MKVCKYGCNVYDYYHVYSSEYFIKAMACFSVFLISLMLTLGWLGEFETFLQAECEE